MFYAAVAARSARVPVLWHVRIAEGDGTGDRWLERRADRIAVISRAVQARFPRADAEGRVRLVYNGVDLAPFARADGQAMRAAMAWDRRPLVGMVAQLVPVKRHADFVEAAARLVGPHPDARFVVGAWSSGWRRWVWPTASRSWGSVRGCRS
jgi:glycosyltransferase involved in cell wall biosynthesis